MSLYTTKYLLIAVVVVDALAYVAALEGFKEFDVSVVANQTMCPIKEELNDDPERTPRFIKFLKCAEQPNSICKKHSVPDGCCNANHHGYTAECVQIHEFVQVKYKDTEDTIRVPVGCSCLLTEKIQAIEVDRAAQNDTDVI